jgi:hypothetical protein
MKDLKTLIYQTTICSLLFLVIGCEVYEEPSYPTLSGTYKVEYISATGQNLLTGEVIDTLITTGGFELKDPIEPFDKLDIGERISFDYGRMFGGYYLSNLGDEWEYTFYYWVYQDLQTMEYRRIEVDYFNTKRVFTIVADGMDYLILSSSGQWEDGSPEKTFTKFTMHLERIGP